MEHKEKDCTHVFSNGTEFGLFIETYCFNCTRYRNDHCKTLNRIYLAMLDDFLFRCWQMGWLNKYEVPRMTVRDMISRLRTQETVLIRDETNYNIGIFDSDSRGLKPYMDRSVGDWFPGCPPGSMGVDFVIMLGGDSDDA